MFPWYLSLSHLIKSFVPNWYNLAKSTQNCFKVPKINFNMYIYEL